VCLIEVKCSEVRNDYDTRDGWHSSKIMDFLLSAALPQSQHYLRQANLIAVPASSCEALGSDGNM